MRTITLFSFLLAATTLFSQGQPKPVFKEKSKEFKDVKVGEVITFFYEFTNEGTADFIISHVHPTCGCTVAEWPKQAIKPGESGKIKVQFDSKDRVGYNAKGVNIESNAGKIHLVFEVYVIE